MQRRQNISLLPRDRNCKMWISQPWTFTWIRQGRVGEANRPFLYYAPVSKHKEMTDEARVDSFIQVTVFVYPVIELASMCTGMREKSILYL